MSRLTKKRTDWVRVLAVLGLLTLIGVSCVVSPEQAALAELQDKLDEIGTKVETAQQTADEALALAQSASALDKPAEGEPVLLVSGIALAYEQEGERELITYPVDAVSVFFTYGDFESNWQNRSDIIVQLAWTAGDEERTWQLEFADQVLVPGDPGVKLSDVNLTDWHEYLVYTPVGVPADTEPNLSSVVVEQGDRQSIVGQKVVGTDSVPFQLLGESDDEGRPYVQFLLRDQTPGQAEHTIGYTLVTILEPLFAIPGPPPSLEADPPDPGDSAGQMHCSNCVWGLCKLGCP
jgi:hypothetical protein